MKFDENLRSLRKEKDYSQEYLAEKLGVTRQTISKWENGTAMPDLKKLIELAEFFEVSMDSLLGMDYGTESSQQDYNNDSADNTAAQIQNSNRYTDSLIQKMNRQNHSNIKKLSIILTVVSIALIISIFTSTSSINNLVSRINSLENNVNYFQSLMNNSSNSSYYDDDSYDVEFNSVKIDPEKPYLVDAELKYAPSSYPKNSNIYYLVPAKDGDVKRVDAKDNNGDFIAKTTIDFSLDKPIYFVLDDGENIAKQEVYFSLDEVYGTFESSVYYNVEHYNKDNDFRFTNAFNQSLTWRSTEYSKPTSANMVVVADGKEIHRENLKISEDKTIDDGFHFNIDLPNFNVEIKDVKKISAYVEVTLDNGAICRDWMGNYSYSLVDNGIDLEEEIYMTEYIFSVDGKNVTLQRDK